MLQNSRTLGLAIAVVAGLLLVAGSAGAQSATGTGIVTIVDNLNLVENNGIDFGNVVEAGGGTVTVSQAGVQTCVGPTCFADAAAGLFTVTGSANETVNVTIDPSFTLSGPGTDMTATTNAPPAVLIDGTGSGQFNVGGTLTVGAGQASGSYAGTYAISVAYQ